MGTVSHSYPFLGVFDSLYKVGFLAHLSVRVQMYWSGCYDGFGTGSLDRDADEMGALVEHLGQGDQSLFLKFRTPQIE